MKLLVISLIVAILAGCATAQWQACRGQRWIAACVGAPHRGQPGARCRQQHVWYYDNFSGQCHPLFYWGCGGNRNRWCSRAVCQRVCGRAG